MTVIVTDSSVYLPRKKAEALHLRVVPMGYTVNGRVCSEGYPEHLEPFFREYGADEAACSTFQTPPHVWRGVFFELLAGGHRIVCVTMSSGLSGNYSSALSAAKELGSGNIEVVDSRTTAGGLAFLVERATELACAGESISSIRQEIESLRDRTGIVFTVENMEPLRKSGRLGALRQSVGTILNIRPVLRCRDGKLQADTLVRGRRAQVEEIAKRIPADAVALVVHRFGPSEGAEELRALLRAKCPALRVELREIGPVVGIHLGLSAYGAAFLR